MADGVIVGSAIVNVIEAHADDPDKLLASVGDFAAGLVEAVKSV
jgi:tryptophan synthase alpha subunit